VNRKEDERERAINTKHTGNVSLAILREDCYGTCSEDTTWCQLHFGTAIGRPFFSTRVGLPLLPPRLAAYNTYSRRHDATYLPSAREGVLKSIENADRLDDKCKS